MGIQKFPLLSKTRSGARSCVIAQNEVARREKELPRNYAKVAAKTREAAERRIIFQAGQASLARTGATGTINPFRRSCRIVIIFRNCCAAEHILPDSTRNSPGNNQASSRIVLARRVPRERTTVSAVLIYKQSKVPFLRQTRTRSPRAKFT